MSGSARSSVAPGLVASAVEQEQGPKRHMTDNEEERVLQVRRREFCR